MPVKYRPAAVEAQRGDIIKKRISNYIKIAETTRNSHLGWTEVPLLVEDIPSFGLQALNNSQSITLPTPLFHRLGHRSEVRGKTTQKCRVLVEHLFLVLRWSK